MACPYTYTVYTLNFLRSGDRRTNFFSFKTNFSRIAFTLENPIYCILSGKITLAENSKVLYINQFS